MKRVICDQCKKEVEPTPYGLAPDGWFSVDQRGNFKDNKDLCSTACLVAAFTPPERVALDAVAPQLLALAKEVEQLITNESDDRGFHLRVVPIGYDRAGALRSAIATAESVDQREQVSA